MLAWAGVFVAMAALDFVWIKFIYATNLRRPTQAGVWAALITLLNGAVAIGYVTNPWLLIPAGLGAHAGTWLAVKTHKGA